MIDLASYAMIQERLVLLYKRVAGRRPTHKTAKFDIETVQSFMQFNEDDEVNWKVVMQQSNEMWKRYD